jgi:hypothetical protein
VLLAALLLIDHFSPPPLLIGLLHRATCAQGAASPPRRGGVSYPAHPLARQ